MPKSKKRRTPDQNWSAADHAERGVVQNQNRHNSNKRADRTARLTHNTRAKRDAVRLNLHWTRTQRHVKELRERLQKWDAKHEADQRAREEAHSQKVAQDAAEREALAAKGQKKLYVRPGPETWKLKGAARPAHEVYDFDVRYKDPHVQAHDDARATVARQRNLLATRSLNAAGETGREYLGLLMQLGHLAVEMSKFKSAREAFTECMELDDKKEPITTAREALMRLCVEQERWASAYKLGHEKLTTDESVVVRYSTAVAAFMQESVPRETLQKVLEQAICANIFCAYYLAFYDTFVSMMEYTDELQEADDEPQSSLEEAFEYCSSPDARLWTKPLRAALVEALSTVEPSSLQWNERLDQLEKEFASRNEGQDLVMFSGMYRTTMEILVGLDKVKLM